MREMQRYDFVAYNSINEMVQHLSSIKGDPFSELYSNGHDEEWYGTKSFQDAVERVTKGDKELSKIVRGSEKLDVKIPATGTKRKMITGVCGFMPHVPNYLAGVPNNMIFCKEERVAKKVITVIYGTNMRHDIDVDEVAAVSARVLSCIMSLERKGYRVNLYAASVASYTSDENPRKSTGFITKLKDSGQHLDLIKMAFPMLSASWNRRFGFRFREMCGWEKMGYSIYGKELRQFLTNHKVQYDVALGFYDARELRTVEQLEKLFLESTNKIK